jgi:hypothetical protein
VSARSLLHDPTTHPARIKLKRDDFTKRIGPRAARALNILLAYTDAHGYTFVGHETIASAASGVVKGELRRAQLSTVEQGMKRLLRLGCVTPAAMRRVWLPHTWGGQVERVVRLRRVMVKWAGEHVLVTPETSARLKETHTYGGRRAGAGRPRIDSSSASSVTPALIDQPLIKCGVTEIKCGVSPNSSVGTISYSVQKGSPPKGGDTALARGDFPVFQTGPTPAHLCDQHVDSRDLPPDLTPPPEPDLNKSSPAPLQPEVTVDERGHGLAGGRAAPWQRPAGVPPYPGAAAVPPAYVPNPPQLDATKPEREQVEVLLRAYRGAVESRYKGRCWVLARGELTASKLYPGLVATARVLIENEIAPAAWAAFSVDVWQRHGDERLAKKPPPLRWVYSARRVEEKHGWFRSEESSYGGGRVVWSEAHHELRRRYDSMLADLRRAQSPSSQDVAKIVSTYFGERAELYAQLVSEATKASQETQARLRYLAQKGEWIWGG